MIIPRLLAALGEEVLNALASSGCPSMQTVKTGEAWSPEFVYSCIHLTVCTFVYIHHNSIHINYIHVYACVGVGASLGVVVDVNADVYAYTHYVCI